MRTVPVPRPTSPHLVPGLWLLALLIGCAPIVRSTFFDRDFVAPRQHSNIFNSTSENLLSLAKITANSRALAAKRLHDGASSTGVPAEENVIRITLVTQLEDARSLMPELARNELQAIENEWFSLQNALARGHLSASESFERHTQLLDRQLALRDTLTRGGL